MFTASNLAELIGGEVVGDGSVILTGIAPADVASAGDLTFAEKPSYLAAAEAGLASAILVPRGFEAVKKVLIRVKDARIAIAKVLPLFFPPEKHALGVHTTAVVDSTAQIHATASVGPHCVVGAGVSLGKNSVLMGGNHIGRDSHVGDDVCLHPNVVLYARTQIGNRVSIHAGTTIGSDGYGYVFDQGSHRKMLQVGNVVIHDDVEIGSNTSIDRGALGSTVIGQGTKIDNLVHVAHNVVMGRHCLIMGQVGFAGSTQLSDYVVIASQSGIGGHLKLGAQSTIGAKSGVMRDIAAGETVLGYPSAPDKQAKRQWIAVSKMPDALRRLKTLEKRMNGGK
ncbi:MAG: UDP-3-O-(3-hydroxymyristoyl)glucosamine N-acyltransferase [Prosthecobacter sp.]|uniref:UDP-3-O-(3-hydroxymyristoyl)glucosamine N-acyltransferase n=1 Tax=Prosthecobacter sp. TaxID=1965333 RepID=UPI0025D57FC4|nr:UDP-3-O-(3-hydroxymyristoyl)glucosamine N-acyltransferase [Prosthecobacter sp.]MCF7786403.1 UDP-3-O-(3-hydroxymyristoyl)glucosamine N-acyltransferase [Prosthecobacter sp.]